MKLTEAVSKPIVSAHPLITISHLSLNDIVTLLSILMTCLSPAPQFSTLTIFALYPFYILKKNGKTVLFLKYFEK